MHPISTPVHPTLDATQQPNRSERKTFNGALHTNDLEDKTQYGSFKSKKDFGIKKVQFLIHGPREQSFSRMKFRNGQLNSTMLLLCAECSLLFLWRLSVRAQHLLRGLHVHCQGFFNSTFR